MNNNTDLSDILNRLSILEKRNKHLRYIIYTFMLAFLCFGLYSFQAIPTFQDLKVSRLSLVDADLVPRAVLKIDSLNGSPCLEFFDSKGNILSSIGTDKEEPYINFYHGNNTTLDIS